MDQQLSMYFNTVPINGSDLIAAQSNVAGQNKEVLEFFMQNPGKEFTPFEVADNIHTTAPITSIRRAINTLTDRGWLVKTGNTKPGLYGTANNTWRLAR